MTDGDWLKSIDPARMLEFLGLKARERRVRLFSPKAGERKVRLFGCACCRSIWHLLAADESRRAVEVAEAFADGRASAEQLAAAVTGAWVAAVTTARAGPATWAAEAVGMETRRAMRAAVEAAAGMGWTARRARFLERQAQADLLRCIFGNPLRSAPALGESILTWDGGAVVKLAGAVYEERAFDRLGVLADMLEEAGCTDAAILNHCRRDQRHARGCLVVDHLKADPAPA